ncbi:MAG TPA: ABC transporter substrate-binding protein [Usitatibacter sp.]|nr:ABC transporter substrate-binding protein [Usitatibacter sp.]
MPGTLLRCGAALVAAMLFATPAGARLLRHASQVDPGTMDPHAIATLYNNRVLSQVYEPLVDRDEQFRPGPRLALSWTPLEGGAGWRFKLRPNVKFHDGTPFGAEDVVFNVKRAMDPLSAMKATLPNVSGARKVDALTVDILTTQPTPILPLAMINLRLMSKAWCEKHRVERPQDFKAKEETYATRNANGTGPYRLKRWDTDVTTVLVASPDYWGKRGNVTEAHFLVVASAATRVAGLISGDIDIVVDPAVQDVVRLRGQAGIHVGEATGLGAQFLGFHHGRAEIGAGAKGNPFKDARVRQAVRAAIDTKALQTKVMRGTAEIGRAIYTSAVDGFDQRFKVPHAFDPARAKALLAQAGYRDGFAVDLDCSQQQPTDAICQAIAGMLSRVGIRVTYRPLPFNVLLPKILSGDTAMYVIGWTPATGEPEGALISLVHSRSKPGVGEYNFGAYSNPKVDAAIDQGRMEFDPAKRAARFTEAMLAIDAEAGFIPLIYRNITWAMRRNVQAVVRPNDVMDLRMVNVGAP